MITGILLSIPIKILSLIFLLFPVLSMPVGLATALASATTSMWSLNSFLPITTVFTLGGILLAIEIFILMFKFFRFVWSFVPFVGGKGV